MASDSDSVSYLDFDLEIGVGTGRSYPIAVVHSPAGEARATMQFPFDELVLDSRLKDLQIALLRSGGKRRQALTQEESAVQEFGKQLFDALIVGEVRSRYDLSQREAGLQSKGLRLKLRIGSPQLAALPWEFLYDTRNAEYVCLSTNTPVVRYLELPQPIQPLLVTLPLRVLGMIVSPTDLPELDVKREKQRVENALKDLQTRGMVQVTWLAGQTWRDLQRAMRSGTWHIFHFIGHGGFDSNADEGLVALADDEGKAEYMNATQLGRLLADHRSLRLALLNSCEGAKSSELDLFSSTASILVRRGIPAVLAMQYEITDRAAIEFSRAFYEAIADGLPVDAATAEARKAVSFAVNNTIEWGTPVLFMRAPDGLLFRLQPLTIVDRQKQQAAELKKERESEKPPEKEETLVEKVEKKTKRRAEPKKVKPQESTSEKSKTPPLTPGVATLVMELVFAETSKDWGKVIELGERILKTDPNHQPGRSKTAQAYRERGVKNHNDHKYDLAIADYTRAIELDSTVADYVFLRGLSYEWKKEYARSIVDYTAAIKLNPNNAEYYYRRGVCDHFQRDYKSAVADHSSAIRLDPKKADYYQSRGNAYSWLNEYDKAIADHTKAIELDPTKPNYFWERAKRYSRKSDYDRAIADYSRALALDGKNADYYCDRGKSYVGKRDYDRAMLDYNRAIELVPTRADFYYERGKNWSDKRDFTRAIADYTHAIQLDPKVASYYQSRGNAYSWLQEYDKSILDHTKAIELDPTKSQYFWERGKRYASKRDYDRAIADYTRAIAMDNQVADYNFERGKSYYQKKNYDLAIADHTRAIELDSTQADYFWERGKTFSWKSDWDAAKRDYRRAADLGNEEAKKELAKFK
ncbi:MAG: tetratricopeptide repeat protein [Chloroflexi bacterium]|nr:tetratricopeptide repeat protein [Chloroflexota bacterium]